MSLNLSEIDPISVCVAQAMMVETISVHFEQAIHKYPFCFVKSLYSVEGWVLESSNIHMATAISCTMSRFFSGDNRTS